MKTKTSVLDINIEGEDLGLDIEIAEDCTFCGEFTVVWHVTDEGRDDEFLAKVNLVNPMAVATGVLTNAVTKEKKLMEVSLNLKMARDLACCWDHLDSFPEIEVESDGTLTALITLV